jgi:glycosyltransferase involved in cell wall biosynthesis
MTAGTAEPRRPRVAVNLLWCVPGAVGGSEQYLVRQVAGLAEQPEVPDVHLFTTAAFRDAHRDELGWCTFVVSPHDNVRRAQRVYDEHTWLYGQTAGFDLVHHGGGTAPRRTRQPVVLTIHDLQYRTFPRYFSAMKRRYLDLVVPGSARRSSLVAVPSEYVRDSVVSELGVDAARVHVVPHGYEPDLLLARTAESDLRGRWGLGDARVIVYPAMTAPHKRHDFLVALMNRHWTDPLLRLVLIGGVGAAESALERQIAALPPTARDRIVRAGRGSDLDRNGLLAMAEALVFPSEYEGFGAPVVEAMALGTPVVCSDATCLPAVVGPAAVVRPLRLDAWADALDEVDRRRDELIAAGRDRARRFTTAVSGRALLAAYQQVVAG